MGVGLGGVGWDGNVHVPCVHTWMLRCCYVTGHGVGRVGWDGNVHVHYIYMYIYIYVYVYIYIYMYIFDIKSCITRGFHR